MTERETPKETPKGSAPYSVYIDKPLEHRTAYSVYIDKPSNLNQSSDTIANTCSAIEVRCKCGHVETREFHTQPDGSIIPPCSKCGLAASEQFNIPAETKTLADELRKSIENRRPSFFQRILKLLRIKK